jgi:hypothetical protein
LVLGIMTRTAMARAVNMAILLGVGVNLSLWIFFPQVSWLWWILIGFVLTFGVGWLMSLPCRVQLEQGEKVIIVAESKSQVNWRPRYAVFRWLLCPDHPDQLCHLFSFQMNRDRLKCSGVEIKPWPVWSNSF